MDKVLLLREPTRDSPDRYESTFKSSGYDARSVAVLETVLTNIANLKTIICDGPSSGQYAGVIITSGRACEAWRNAIQDLTHTPSIAEAPGGWPSIPFYVVGNATATLLAELRDAHEGSDLVPKIILGESSGTSEQLAHFILDDLNGRSAKLLYLTGDKNRDILSNILHTVNVDLQPLQVYKTQGLSTFAHNLEETMKSAYHESDRWWIVYFAPSAAAFVTPILLNYFNLRFVMNLSYPQDSRLLSKIAAIGPTSAAFLRDELRLVVDVTAPKPTPEELVASIAAHDGVS